MLIANEAGPTLFYWAFSFLKPLMDIDLSRREISRAYAMETDGYICSYLP